MANRKGKARVKKRRVRGKGLNGFATTKSSSLLNSGKETLVLCATAFAGGVIGSAAGGPLSLLGIPAVFAGFHLQHKHPLVKYLIPLGAGMFLANGFKKADGTVNGVDGVDGLDLKSAQQRVKNYFSNFSDKFALPGAKAVNGLDGNEQVTYFINPYGQDQQAIDTSAMDRIQAQIAEMSVPTGYPVNGAGTVGELAGNQGYPAYFNEVDPTEANF